jgi:hypothetical protein
MPDNNKGVTGAITSVTGTVSHITEGSKET